MVVDVDGGVGCGNFWVDGFYCVVYFGVDDEWEFVWILFGVEVGVDEVDIDGFGFD